ncbi:hypothetical protein AYJ57_17390 [Salipiger sp. CCB-MM3]|uniref:four-carbon acid sugar kinase family protein n=1 Tax=Salipiger sp. CCB-MM3 TaxID=1792508 RepID=UPI00080AB80A|nr:four-carbon acid sugar kinase family protein [Salipiger sp. CCB-MM3]ANT62201.1 hypothetical protein AYJ57_17390 [Salipiger sp. CCB-MM3]
MTLACGIIADDFTGAMLVAAYCETAGVACPVYFTAEALADAPDSPLAVLAARTRLAPPDQARSDIAVAIAAMRDAGAEALVYKACGTFDSTEEGNIGIAADLLRAEMDQDLILLSAGFPDYGVTVHQGHMFLGARPINESDKRHDPVTPMPDANLVRFLGAQVGREVGLISHLEMIKGKPLAQAALDTRRAEGHAHVLCDLCDDADLAMSLALAESDRAVVASDPLTVAFALDRARHSGATLPPPDHAGGPAALFVGSVGPVAGAQIAAFETRHPVLRLDLTENITEQALIERAAEWAAARVAQGPFGITTWADAAQVARSQAAYGRLGAARRAERILAEIAQRCHEIGIRRFLVGGGETSGAIVTALGLTKVRALPLGALRGGLCVAEGPDPISLYLKSGKLGDSEVFLSALEIMAPARIPETTR